MRRLRGPSSLAAVFHRLRLSEPWRYKAPFLIAVPYYLLYVESASFRTALVSIGWALGTIAGIAGFAYLSNDIFDRRADRLAGRFNATADLSGGQIALAFAGFLAAALVPWVLYFPLDSVSVGLLAAEFVLLLVYSVPPLRLKERGLAGPIADALYAHAVPALLAAHCFHVLLGRGYGNYAAFAVILGTWQFVVGLRNVLTHQMTDLSNDSAAGTSTWVMRRGGEATATLLGSFLVPVELMAWAAFTVVVAVRMPLVGPAWPVYVVAVAANIRLRLHESLRSPLLERLEAFLNEYYLRWLPLVILVGLCLRDVRMVALLAVHLVIFRHGLTPSLAGLARAARSGGRGVVRGLRLSAGGGGQGTD